MKNSYILLRNNKESTALSIEQLQEIGLKKTDLIWVECQSMDWRSPDEIAELKNLVSSGNNEDKKNSTEKLISPEEPNRDELIKKQVAGKTWTHLNIKNLGKFSHPENVILSGLEDKEIDLMPDKSSSPGGIKRISLRNPEQREQRKKNVFAIQLPEQVKKMVLYAGLVLTGALLMLLIKNLTSKRPDAVQQTKAPPGDSAAASIATLPGVLKDTVAIAAGNIAAPDTLTEKSSATAMKEQKRQVTTSENIPLKTDATTRNPG